MQYMIFLTDGKEETCCVISGNGQSATDTFHVMAGIVKREVAWLELREYENATTNEYQIIEKQKNY